MSNELDDKINEAPIEALGENLKEIIGSIIELEKSNKIIENKKQIKSRRKNKNKTNTNDKVSIY